MVAIGVQTSELDFSAHVRKSVWIWLYKAGSKTQTPAKCPDIWKAYLFIKGK